MEPIHVPPGAPFRLTGKGGTLLTFSSDIAHTLKTAKPLRDQARNRSLRAA
jgi:hypothetical protein